MQLKIPTWKRQVRERRRGEKGQVTVFVLLVLGIFLLGFIGFAVDMTNVWFHRQSAQGATDAACQAGIMDVLEIAQGTLLPSPGPGFTPGTAFDCSGSSAATPCWYASKNGFSGTGLVANTDSNDVAVSFPSSNPALPPCSSTLTTNCIPPASVAPFPFLEVDLTDRFRLTFASLISGQKTMDVKAKSVCALVLVQVPTPIIIMNPVCPWTLHSNGSGGIGVVGGPVLSIQVNSSSTTAVPSSTGTIDLSKGGPSHTGSDLGVLGGVGPTPPGSFLPGTTGAWVYPHLPISDPFYNLPVPTPPPAPCTGGASHCPEGTMLGGVACATNPCPVIYGSKGCPDSTGGTSTYYVITTTGCLEFAPGLYT